MHLQTSDPEDKDKLELKLYTTNMGYSELQTLAMDIRKGNQKHDDLVISEWIKVIMGIWGTELNERPEDAKMCVKGKTDSGTFTQVASQDEFIFYPCILDQNVHQAPA